MEFMGGNKLLGEEKKGGEFREGENADARARLPFLLNGGEAPFPLPLFALSHKLSGSY